MNTTYKVKTHKNLKLASADLKANLKEIGFGVLFELNFKDKVKEKGFDIDDNFIMMDVCNPKVASQILGENIEMGYILPCKVVVYDKGDERFIGLLNPTTLVSLIDDKYKDVAATIEENLKAAIDKSV